MAGAKVRIHDARDSKWRSAREAATPEVLALLSEGELSSEIYVHERGTEDSPRLSEVRFPPHAAVEVHSHDEDEIIYIVKGELRLGQRPLGPGSSLFVSGGTFYSFSAGPAGVQFLNFRPRKDGSYNLPPPRSRP